MIQATTTLTFTAPATKPSPARQRWNVRALRPTIAHACAGPAPACRACSISWVRPGDLRVRSFVPLHHQRVIFTTTCPTRHQPNLGISSRNGADSEVASIALIYFLFSKSSTPLGACSLLIRLTGLTKRIFNVPIALISIVDNHRQWFKSGIGIDFVETPRDISFYAHAIHGDDILVIPDAKLDARFSDNPLVVGSPNIRFYAGYPIKAINRQKLGTLYIIDRMPRNFSNEDTLALRDLAADRPETTGPDLKLV
ncbi:GAF domain-containing protein [Herbaspirillum sp. C7C8]|uniref:GAF domain-containing protein n=1 Tax=Herbaspirillum sp. C7C8 TaxID=2736665 RepID=UPI001F51D1BC|nr:GAF domain-containing protein [Herbaspirillum sp. C7C8]MCI1007364.1 GAF domain-containing protein [Herbaspirillum sp. C7C8]